MLHQSFQQYTATKGIQLLKDDIKFIKIQLLKIPSEQHRAHLSHYCEEWLKGMSECDIVYRRPNVGRRRANQYLLGVTDARNSKMV